MKTTKKAEAFSSACYMIDKAMSVLFEAMEILEEAGLEDEADELHKRARHLEAWTYEGRDDA